MIIALDYFEKDIFLRLPGGTAESHSTYCF